MALFRREKRAESDVMTPETAFPNDVALKAWLGGNQITAEMAMQIPAFAGCVNFLKDTIAMLPVKLYKQESSDDGKKIIKEIEDDPRCKLLNDDTRDTLSGSEYKAALVKDFLLYGEAYAYIRRQRNDVKSLHYIEHSMYSISRNADPIFKKHEILVDGNTYGAYDFMKILRSTTNGATGLGVVEENPEVLRVAYNTLVFEGSLVSKGGNKKGFLKSQKRLTQEAIDALKTAWKNLYANNEENVVILNDGLEFQESSATSVELQLNQNKITNKKEICSIFKIAPSVLDEKATDEEYNLTIKMAVLPILNEIIGSLNRDLLLEREKDTYFFAFDTAEIMRGDLEKRYSAYKAAVEAGWITKNEIRAKENMVAIPGLDIVSMSLGDVIYDIENETFFTPNTSTITDADGETKQIEPEVLDPEPVPAEQVKDKDPLNDGNMEKGGTTGEG